MRKKWLVMNWFEWKGYQMWKYLIEKVISKLMATATKKKKKAITIFLHH